MPGMSTADIANTTPSHKRRGLSSATITATHSMASSNQTTPIAMDEK
jgi:hypothetical protein